MEPNIEKGKAIIQLAQIIMILAGFLFATSGVAYTNSIATTAIISSNSNQLLSIFTDLNNKTLVGETLEVLNSTIFATQSLIESNEHQLNLVELTFILGVLLSFLSIIVWSIGYGKISKGEGK